MIVTQIKRSRFGTGIEAIRVASAGVLIEVDADRSNRQSVAQIAEAEGPSEIVQIGSDWRLRESGDYLLMEVLVADVWTLKKTFERPI